MKAFRIIRNSIRDAFKSVFRNFSLSMASILCATITLLIMSISLLIAGNIKNAASDLEKELNIVVYVEKSATESDIENIKNSITKIENVENVTYKSKDEWKSEMSEYNPSFSTIFENYDVNPLLDSFIVKVNDINNLSKITEEIKKIDKIDSANYGESAIDVIVSAFNIVEKVTIIIVVSLVIVTAFLITNTIKLTIYSRKQQIEIMRLVGASNIAIKLPFVFEGFIIGVLGSLIPIIVTIYGYIIAYDKLNGHILTDIIRLVSPYNYVFSVSFVILCLGALIGMTGSLSAVRKYLKI